MIILVFTSCELRDDAEPTQLADENSKRSAYTSITQEPGLVTVLSEIKTRAMRSSSNSNNISFGNLDIETARFLKILQPNKSFIYTFEIKDAELKNKYRNLLLKEVNGGFVATIVEYEPEQKAHTSQPNYNTAKFSGVSRRYNLEGKLLRTITVKDGKQTSPDTSESSVSINRTTTNATAEIYCVQYMGDYWDCIQYGLPTESPGPGECIGGGTWTHIYLFEQVPCTDSGGTYDGGSGGYYDGSGSYIPSDPLNPESGTGSPGEVIGIIEPSPRPEPELHFIHLATILELSPNSLPYNWLENNQDVANIIFSLLMSENNSQNSIELALDIINNEFDIIAFEEEYRLRMSMSELNIFDKMILIHRMSYLANAQFATWKSETLYPSSLYNGKGDAYRHAYFNALNLIDLGASLAESLATAHEDKPYTYSNNFKEMDMDLFNNRIGREKWNFSFDGFKSLEESVIHALNSGQLRYLNNLAPDGKATDASILIPTNQ